MKSFELVEPATVDEAIALLDPDDPGVRVMSGGTALMLMMKMRLFQPTRLISLRRLNGTLRQVRAGGDGAISIGALTSLTALEGSPLVAQQFPVVRSALRTLSNVRIRNVATLGGHLAHGDPHMDLPPILLTLGARVGIAGRGGERWIGVEDFFRGYYQTALGPDELITEVRIPAQPRDVRSWYAKYTALSTDDWPAVGAAVWLRLASGSIAEARIAIGAATERAARVASAEGALAGTVPDRKAFGAAADAAAAAIEPMADIRGSAAYKREMVRVHVRRALEQAMSNPGGAA
jgi:carbon-monoxide dehydrogenase medium subunit